MVFGGMLDGMEHGFGPVFRLTPGASPSGERGDLCAALVMFWKVGVGCFSILTRPPSPLPARSRAGGVKSPLPSPRIGRRKGAFHATGAAPGGKGGGGASEG